MSDALRLSLVTETYFPQINGVSRTLDRLVRHLHEAGDEVQLLTPAYDEPAEVPPGVAVEVFSGRRFPLYPEILLPFTRAVTVEQKWRDFRPDLIHIATEGPLGLAALRAARRLGIPVVSSYHTNFSFYLGKYHLSLLGPLCWRYLRWFHNATAATFCPTPSIGHILQERGFSSVHIWSRGVDAHRFHPGLRDGDLRRQLGLGEAERVLLYVGRLAPEKNLETLMSAWRHLPPGHDARLVLVGDGPLRESLQRQSDDRVIFAGYRQGEELARLYALADLFVFPSLSETFGNVMLEAMASGVPTLGFRVPGPQDVVEHGRTGILVDEVSPAAFGAALNTVLHDEEGLRRLGREARAYACRQDWRQINAGVRRIYADILRQDRSRQFSCTLNEGHRARKEKLWIDPLL
ncbi:MAG: glycosyltransferase family 4 protein [Desulfuromonadales bacterium]